MMRNLMRSKKTFWRYSEYVRSFLRHFPPPLAFVLQLSPRSPWPGTRRHCRLPGSGWRTVGALAHGPLDLETQTEAIDVRSAAAATCSVLTAPSDVCLRRMHYLLDTISVLRDVFCG